MALSIPSHLPRHNLTISKPDHPIDKIRVLKLVRNHQDRLPRIPVQHPEELKNLPRRDAIQIRGRLVGKENLWLVDERPRNRNPLLLAA